MSVPATFDPRHDPAPRTAPRGAAPAAPAKHGAAEHIPVRAPKFTFGEDFPRSWLGGSRVASHLVAGVSLLFPEGERFFIRAARAYAKDLPETLAAEVRSFSGQEGRHAIAHGELEDALRAQGYPVDRILARYTRVAYGPGGVEDRSPAGLRLATTAALEHFTATLAVAALERPVLELAHPEARKLLSWHALEELEHAHVTFDLLQLKAPGYLLRVAGLAMGVATLGAFWVYGTGALLAHDGIGPLAALRELRAMRRAAASESGTVPVKGVVRDVFLAGALEYLRPGFHPREVATPERIAAARAAVRALGVDV